MVYNGLRKECGFMKKLISILLIFIYALLTPISTPQVVQAATVKYIVQADVEYMIGINEKITLHVNTKKKVTWSSSNKKVATVSSKGVIKGKKEGTVTITAKVGAKKHKCKVIVKDFSDWISFETNYYDIMRSGIRDGDAIYYDDDIYYVSPEYYEEVLVPWMDSINDAETEGANPYKLQTLGPDAKYEFKDDSKDDYDKDALAERMKKIMESGKATSGD